MSKLLDFPLVGGMDQGVDRVIQADGQLQYAQNCRLTRDGRLEVRPSFTALTTTTLASGGPALVAYDVANYAGRLVALGDNTAASRATDLFEYSTLGWRGTAGFTSAVRLPSLTDVRRISGLPDQVDAARNVAIAAGGTTICVVTNVRNSASTTGGALGTTIHVLDPVTDRTVFYQQIADLRCARVVFCNAQYQVFGINAAEDVVSYAVLTNIVGPTARVTLAGDILDLALGTFGTGFALTFSVNGSNTQAFTYNSVGTQQATWVVDAADSQALAIVGNTAGTLLSVVRIDDATNIASIETFNAAGVTQTGPTTLFGGATLGAQLGACLVGTDVLCIATASPDTLIQRAAQTGHALGSLRTYYTARLECAPVAIGTRAFFGVYDFVSSTISPITFHMVDEAQLLPQVYIQVTAGVNSSENATHTPAVLGTKLYFATTERSEETGNLVDARRFQVFEAETLGTARRQMAQVGGELLISGGVPLTYDSRTLSEQGFAERPSLAVTAPAQGTVGALTLLGTYNAVVVWEVFGARGLLLRSQASEPAEVVLTGANDSITWTCSTPHSLRRHPNYAAQGLTVRVRLYRTEADQGVFFLDNEATIPLTASPAQTLTIVSSQSDLMLSDNVVMYEQSQTPVSHVSPPPHKYVHVMHERALAGGASDDYTWTASKLLFPAEPVEWAPAGRLGFSSRVGQPITAVAAFETVGLIFTASQIYQLPGRGPERNGTGDFDAATSIATPGGCIDWRSVLVTPAGCFFQMRADMLMLLTRGGEVQWAGKPVQDTLALFPTIVGAVFVRADDLVVFACNNLAGNDGVLLCFDLSNGQWFVDTIGAAITSVTELDGRLVYVAAGTVLQQNTDVGTGAGALPTLRVEKQFKVFPMLGQGTVCKVMLLGTYLGDCAVDGYVSYDDSKTWTLMSQQAVTAANLFNPVSGAALSSGDPVTIVWTPNRREVDRFALRFDVTNATNTGGMRIHSISLEIEGNDFATRQPARNQR